MKGRLLDILIKQWPLILIFLISAIIVLVNWHKPGYLIYFWDQTFPLNPNVNLRSLFSIWHGEYDFGRPDTTAVSLIPYFLFVSVFTFIFSSVSIAQILLYFLIILSSFLGMYFLVMQISKLRHIAANKEMSTKYIALAVSFFYVLNPFALFFEWRIVNSTIFLTALLPWLFVILIRNMQQPSWLNIALFGVITLLMSPGLSNPAFIPIVGLLGLGFIGLACRQSKKSIKGILGLLLIFIMVSSYWAIPVFNQVSSVKDAGTYGGVETALIGNSKNLSIDNVFRFIGSSPITETYKNEPAYTWAWLYDNKYFTLIPFISLLIAVVGLFFYKGSHSRGVLIFLLLFLLFVALSKGIYPPFEGVFKMTFDNIAFFKAYRDPFSKFGLGLLFSFVILLALLLMEMFKHTKKKWVTDSILTSIVLSVAVFNWPLLTGDVFRSEGPVRPSAYIKIPHEYTKVAKILEEENKGQRILSLPRSTSPLQSSNWDDGIVSFDPLRLLSGQPLISTVSDSTEIESYKQQLHSMLSDSSRAINAYSKLDIGWVVIRWDNNDAFDKTTTSKELKKIALALKNDSRVKVAHEGDRLLLLKLNHASPPSLAYGSKSILKEKQSANPLFMPLQYELDESKLNDQALARVEVESYRIDVGDQNIKLNQTTPGKTKITIPAYSQGSIITSKDLDINKRYVGITYSTSQGAVPYIAFSKYSNNSFERGGEAALINEDSLSNSNVSEKFHTLVYDISTLNFVPNRVHVHATSSSSTDTDLTILNIFQTDQEGLSKVKKEDRTYRSFAGSRDSKKTYNVYSPWLKDSDLPYLAMDIKTSSGYSFFLGISKINNGKYIEGEYIKPIYFPIQKANADETHSSEEWSTFYFPVFKKDINYLNFNIIGNSSASKNESAAEVKNIHFSQYAGGPEDILNYLAKDTASVVSDLPIDKPLPYYQMVGKNSVYSKDLRINERTLLGLPERYSKDWILKIEPIESRSGCLSSGDQGLSYTDTQQATSCTSKYNDIIDSTLLNKNTMHSTHTTLNGFANAWELNPEFIKTNFSKKYYQENTDGSISISLSAHFKPQVHFYVGLIISSTALLACTAYLLWFSYRHTKQSRHTHYTAHPEHKTRR